MAEELSSYIDQHPLVIGGPWKREDWRREGEKTGIIKADVLNPLGNFAEGWLPWSKGVRGAETGGKVRLNEHLIVKSSTGLKLL